MAVSRQGQRTVQKAMVLAGAVALAAAINACSSSASSSSSSPSSSSDSAASSAKGVPTVAFVPGIAKIPFYDTLSAGIAQEAKALGWNYYTQGSSSAFSVSAQTPIVAAVCSKHPTFLLIAPTDPNAMRSPIQQCMSEGVKVILVDTTLTDTSGIIATVSSNNTLGGQLAAQYVAKELGGHGVVSVQTGSPEAETQAARREGFVGWLTSHDTGITFLQPIYAGSESQAETDTSATLTATPNVGAIFNTTSTCQGPSQAIQSHGGHKPILVCYDDSPAVTTLLEQGKVGATVLQDPRAEGVTAVKYADDEWTGKSSVIPKSTVVTPVLITASTVNSPVAKQDLYLP